MVIVGTIGVRKVIVICVTEGLKPQLTESMSCPVEVSSALFHNGCRLPKREVELTGHGVVRCLAAIVIGSLSGRRWLTCTAGAHSHRLDRGRRGCFQWRDRVLISARLRAHMIPSD